MCLSSEGSLIFLRMRRVLTSVLAVDGALCQVLGPHTRHEAAPGEQLRRELVLRRLQRVGVNWVVEPVRLARRDDILRILQDLEQQEL